MTRWRWSFLQKRRLPFNQEQLEPEEQLLLEVDEAEEVQMVTRSGFSPNRGRGPSQHAGCPSNHFNLLAMLQVPVQVAAAPSSSSRSASSAWCSCDSLRPLLPTEWQTHGLTATRNAVTRLRRA